MEMIFDINEAVNYDKEGRIEEWVHLFLRSVGNNVPFSDGLKLQERYWVGPILIDLDLLNRICGPEETIQFQEPIKNWERRIKYFESLIKDGWNMPPLIVNHSEGYLEVNDGNHRHEALKRAGFTKFWTILWDSDSKLNLEEYKMKNDIMNILGSVFGSTITNFKSANSGNIKDVYFFECKNKKYVISFSKTEKFENASYLEILLNKNLVESKQTVASGIFEDKYYSITNKLEGETPDFVDENSFKNILPEIINKITEVHNIDINDSKGFGWIDEYGNGKYSSMQEFIEDFFAEKQNGFWKDWYELFDTSFLDFSEFSKLYKKMMELVKYSDVRYLTHGDFHLNNILIKNGDITGIIDWDNAMYGDFIYDIACIQMQLPQYEIKESFEEYYKNCNIEVPYFNERFKCMSLLRGLDSLRFFSKYNDKGSYDSVLKYLKDLL